MFPDIKFLTIDLYTWMIIVGVLFAIVAFRILCDKTQIDAKVFNFALFVCVVCVVIGYLSAVLFQSWYHYLATGEWKWGTGATFYGGLIGAVIGFFAGYFVIGHFLFKDKKHIAQIDKVVACAFPCIVLAHSFGRIGCLFAGCCYGLSADPPFGLKMLVNGEWQYRLPTQLYEAIFLLLLFVALIYLLLKKKCIYTPSVYLIAYGTWRFVIEYVRDDDERGSSGISWLTPSQLTAIIMIVIGIALIFLYQRFIKKYLKDLQKTINSQVAPAEPAAEPSQNGNLIVDKTDDKHQNSQNQ